MVVIVVHGIRRGAGARRRTALTPRLAPGLLLAFELVRVAVLVLREPQYRYRKVVGAHDRSQVRPLIAAEGVALLRAAILAQRDLLLGERGLAIGVIALSGADVLAVDVDAGIGIGYANARSARARAERGQAGEKYQSFHRAASSFWTATVYS